MAHGNRGLVPLTLPYSHNVTVTNTTITHKIELEMQQLFSHKRRKKKTPAAYGALLFLPT